MAGEKTEKATPKRRQDERKKGNIFQSKEIVVVFSLIIVFFSLKVLLPLLSNEIQSIMRDFITRTSTVNIIDIYYMQNVFLSIALVFLKTAMPLLLISAFSAIVFSAFQTRLLFTSKNIAFKFDRINPLKGIKKIFSLRGLFELIKSILKIIILSYIIYNTISKNTIRIFRLMDQSINAAIFTLGEIIFSVITNVAIIFVALAVFDYFYQWWDYEKNLRMSKQEIKEEYKQMEGDPQVKGKIKELQRQRAQNRMMQSVPDADVIIRNPTHYAVAIKYDEKANEAPVVLAKGADYIALKIIKIAEENNVSTVENKPLARGLYESVEIEHQIPKEFYNEVAEVLAFIYSINKKKGK